MKHTQLFFVALFLCTYNQIHTTNPFEQQLMTIIVPTANLRAKPNDNYQLSYKAMDWEQTSQLLFGEPILVQEKRNGWLRIKTIGQKIYTNNKWYELSGWIKAEQATHSQENIKYNLIVHIPKATINTQQNKIEDISLGTKLHGISRRKGYWRLKLPDGTSGFISEKSVTSYNPKKIRNKRRCRHNIIATAKQFLGNPYLWGGRSFYNPGLTNQITSVDCSSLVELCYKVNGIPVARNSKSQYQQCKKLISNPKIGDLMFWATHPTSESIKHVRIYSGDDNFIEAYGGKIRKIRQRKGKETFGRPIKQLKSGDPVWGGYIYFGRII